MSDYLYPFKGIQMTDFCLRDSTGSAGSAGSSTGSSTGSSRAFAGRSS
jgi:hypothetical protein